MGAVNPTPRAQTYRAHKAATNARRKLDDPMLRAAVLSSVFGRRWTYIVQRECNRLAAIDAAIDQHIAAMKAP